METLCDLYKMFENPMKKNWNLTANEVSETQISSKLQKRQPKAHHHYNHNHFYDCDCSGASGLANQTTFSHKQLEASFGEDHRQLQKSKDPPSQSSQQHKLLYVLEFKQSKNSKR